MALSVEVLNYYDHKTFHHETNCPLCKPELDFHEVTLEGEENPSVVFVEAVSPDFKHYVSLFGKNGTFHSLIQKFNRPEDLPYTWLSRPLEGPICTCQERI